VTILVRGKAEWAIIGENGRALKARCLTGSEADSVPSVTALFVTMLSNKN
jgi:hypothetical protein